MLKNAMDWDAFDGVRTKIGSVDVLFCVLNVLTGVNTYAASLRLQALL